MFETLARPVFVAGIVMALLSGCAKTRVHSQVSTTIQGREVVASIDGPAFIGNSPNNNAAIVTFAGKRVVVEKERIVIDGKVQATVPADASKIELSYSLGSLTVTADGKEVLKSAL